MSKTFDSATNNGTEVCIGDGIGSTTFHLMIRDVGATVGKVGIYLPASEAPALALAILEVAGFVGDETLFSGLAVANLRDHIEEQERVTAEAKEQAELEAEALELFKAAFPRLIDEQFLSTEQAELWLRVARKAREMAKED